MANIELREGHELDKLAEQLFIAIASRVPGVTKAREATPAEDSGLENDPAIDAVAYVGDHHAFVAQVTTASAEKKQEKMHRQMSNRLFVQTSKLSDKVPGDPVVVPRFNIRIDNGTMRRFEVEPDVAKHPDIEKSVRSQLLVNLAMMLWKMESDENGKVFNKKDLADAKSTEQYKQVAGLVELFDGVEEVEKFKKYFAGKSIRLTL